MVGIEFSFTHPIEMRVSEDANRS